MVGWDWWWRVVLLGWRWWVYTGVEAISVVHPQVILEFKVEGDGFG
jgi:hypothetical protein